MAGLAAYTHAPILKLVVLTKLSASRDLLVPAVVPRCSLTAEEYELPLLLTHDSDPFKIKSWMISSTRIRIQKGSGVHVVGPKRRSSARQSTIKGQRKDNLDT